jgi:hypothetical protein
MRRESIVRRPRARSRAPTAVLFIALAAAFLATGCQQFFTTSLASGLARSSLPIPANLSTSQASDLASQAKDNQDTKLASALVSSLVTQIAATSDPGTKEELQASAATAAIIASGTSTALTGLITTYGSTGTFPSDAATLTSLLTDIQTGSSGTGVVAALSYLDPAAPGGGVSAAQASASGLGATDLAIAAVVIAASVIPPGQDPATFDSSTLSPADKATFTTAQNIATQAQTLVVPGSASADLLNSFVDKFKLTP